MPAKPKGFADRFAQRKEFWQSMDQLIANQRIVVDRPKGSRHPRYPDLIYPFDYGYLDDTRSPDGDGIDVWIGTGGIQQPRAVLFTIDLGKKDLEIKIILGCSDEEIQVIMDFVNNHSMRSIMIEREWNERELLRNRHSIRWFTDQAIPRTLINQVLEAATWAPSAHNSQPWRIVVLTSPQNKARLAEAMSKDFRRDLARDGLDQEAIQAQIKRSGDRISEAPVCLVLNLDIEVGDHYSDQRRSQAEHHMGVQSVAMAGQNLMLAATTLGLGSVWMCAPLFAPEAVRQALDLPATWLPQGLILLGYPAQEPVFRPRLPVDEVARFL